MMCVDMYDAVCLRSWIDLDEVVSFVDLLEQVPQVYLEFFCLLVLQWRKGTRGNV
jgi:hypothetical protein